MQITHLSIPIITIRLIRIVIQLMLTLILLLMVIILLIMLIAMRINRMMLTQAISYLELLLIAMV